MNFIERVLENIIGHDFTEPLLSISDIMNWDLGSNNTKQKKTRTDDDLLHKNKDKDDKVNRIADEILFYLIAESRSNLFPKRVNPEKLKLITEEEIAKFEKEKEIKALNEF